MVWGNVLSFYWCRPGIWLHHYGKKRPYCWRILALSLAPVPRGRWDKAATSELLLCHLPKNNEIISYRFLFLQLNCCVVSNRWLPISTRTTTTCGSFTSQMTMKVSCIIYLHFQTKWSHVPESNCSSLLFVSIKPGLEHLPWFVMVTSFDWNTKSKHNEYLHRIHIGSIIALLKTCVDIEFKWWCFSIMWTLHSISV